MLSWDYGLRQIQKKVSKLDDDGALSIRKLLLLIGLSEQRKFRDFFLVPVTCARFQGSFVFF
jgi:hypothetical protein